MFISWVITLFTLLSIIAYYSDQVEIGTLFQILLVYTYIKLLSTLICPGIPLAVGCTGTAPAPGLLPVAIVKVVNEPVT